MYYHFLLTRQQVEFLLETVQAFVDNQKLIHIPDQSGEIVGLPLPEEQLKHLLSIYKDEMLEGKQEVRIEMEAGLIKIQIAGFAWEYTVDLEQFDEQ